MLEWFFGSKDDPPTDKQLRYARKLGIYIPKNAGKSKLSQLISEAEFRNPSLRDERENAKTKQKINNHGQDKVDEESKWNALADAGKWMLVVFSRGKTKVAEVVRINGASISTAGKVKIECEIMKVAYDKHYGDELVVPGRAVAISTDNIEWHEIISEIEIDSVRLFKKHLGRVKAKV